MLESLQQYLTPRAFVEVAASAAQQRGVAVRAYENGEFRVHVVNERESEIYVQVAPLQKPEERRFLAGVVAFLAEDDSVTQGAGPYHRWLEQHHAALVTFFASSPEGQAQRERYAAWEQEFAKREQSRLATLAAARSTQTKPWWKLW